MSAEQMDVEQSLARTWELEARAFAEPDLAAARASASPQSMYVDLAAERPVRDLGDGFYLALRMEDIVFMTRNRAVNQGTPFLGSDRPAIPLGLDGPVHTSYRRLLDPVFTLKRVAPLAARVRELANDLIDRFYDAGRADAYQAWCEPLPSSIFLSIMGLPMKDLEDFIRFKNMTLGANTNDDLSTEERLASVGEAVRWIQDYFDSDLADRAKESTPRDDMIGMLMTTEVAGKRLSREEILDILGLLMIAGLDTVTASLACFLSYFARHPEQRRRIVESPALIPSAVEELMRFESPVTGGQRLVLEDLPLPSGYSLPAGAFVHVSWAAANMDPDFFENPLEVDLERSPNRHIGFASGYHRCLGSHLARMELQTAMAVWHERIPDYQIEGDLELVYEGNPRAPHQFPLVWSA